MVILPYLGSLYEHRNVNAELKMDVKFLRWIIQGLLNIGFIHGKLWTKQDARFCIVVTRSACRWNEPPIFSCFHTLLSAIIIPKNKEIAVFLEFLMNCTRLVPFDATSATSGFSVYVKYIAYGIASFLLTVRTEINDKTT